MSRLKEELKSLAFFADIDDEIVSSVADIATIKAYSKDTLLFYEEEKIDYFYILISGTIRVYKTDRFGNEVFLYFIDKGELISEFESLDKPACFANLSFDDDSSLLMISFARFRELLEKHSILYKRLLDAFIHKTTKLHCALNRESVFDVSAKVAHFLRFKLDEFNSTRRQEVAKRLNIQPETLSRVLRKLIRDKVIIQKDDKIVIENQTKLEEIYK